ncbi:Acg family FMN-binding oxidoreductase [Pedobacter mendelii]|uniref:Tat pathway signal protein n=1 Tax=Pedobacter mendelii TaxID=1908240 RepID=A0ABQ2BN89_9SPHI|nr:nitroreductase [Pedobacter mendelii]GGI29179.1 Tat pathway signal protein [Pedobacter mendelii]
MNRRKFLAGSGATIVIVGVTGYMLSDMQNFERSDSDTKQNNKTRLKADEIKILSLASLAPSGHNTQPWFIKSLAPYHWIICNDKKRWLPAVDPSQRETVLSIGAFLQNLTYAADSIGYKPNFKLMATTNQDEEMMEVKLIKSGKIFSFDTETIRQRRTVRSNMLVDAIKKEDLRDLISEDPDMIHFISASSREYGYLNEQTIEANRIQSYRNAAQNELSNWIRFSSKDAKKKLDGLTTGSMEIDGIPGWMVRNFYDRENVMSKSFRDRGIAQVEKQVASSAGWFLISSKEDSVGALIETGKMMQRLFLKVRDKNIGIHPMTQILEEPSIKQSLNTSVGIKDQIQFILRAGYVKNYPDPVSLRRTLDMFVRK